jgi:hypothetical protein
MLTTSSPSQLGVCATRRMPPMNGATSSAHTSAERSPSAEKVTTLSQRDARERTSSTWSVPRLTTATRAWSKMRSLLWK